MCKRSREEVRKVDWLCGNWESIWCRYKQELGESWDRRHP